MISGAAVSYAVAMLELVQERWPVLAGQVASALRAADEPELAQLWPSVYIVKRCGCRDGFCQSFYTQPPPVGAYGAGHRNVVLEPPWFGFLTLDVVGETIMGVEVLYRAPLD